MPATGKRVNVIRKLLKITGLGFFLCILSLASLVVISPFYVYAVFNQELPVARVEFQQLGEFEYLARLSTGDFCESEEYTIQGDQFQLDAGFAKWKGPAVLLGFKPRYRLDRLSGRYRDIRRQNSMPGGAHDLAPDLLFDFFTDINRDATDSWLVDTTFGSSVYQDIEPLQSYTIFATEDGLILRTRPILQYEEESGELIIDITQGCAGADNKGFENLLMRINSL